jgi:Rrf2 family protein
VLIPAKVDYGIRALLVLAAAEGVPHKVEYLSEAQHIPLQYLAVIMAQLARAELVHGQRGPDGGYSLARDPEGITLGDVVHALDEHLVDVQGRHGEVGGIYSGAAENLHHVWTALGASLRSLLEVSLADVLNGEVSSRFRGLVTSPDIWLP